MQADNADLQLMLPNAADTADLNYPCVKIDTQKISKVLRNLISNAIKFTPRGGTVTVSLCIQGVDQTPPPRSYFSRLFSKWTLRHQVVD